MVKGLMNPVRNSSPAIAGLETERGIISNGVNLSAEFNATTGLTTTLIFLLKYPFKIFRFYNFCIMKWI